MDIDDVCDTYLQGCTEVQPEVRPGPARAESKRPAALLQRTPGEDETVGCAESARETTGGNSGGKSAQPGRLKPAGRAEIAREIAGENTGEENAQPALDGASNRENYTCEIPARTSNERNARPGRRKPAGCAKSAREFAGGNSGGKFACFTVAVPNAISAPIDHQDTYLSTHCIHPSICRNARADLHGSMCQKFRPLHARMCTSDIQRGLVCQKKMSPLHENLAQIWPPTATPRAGDGFSDTIRRPPSQTNVQPTRFLTHGSQKPCKRHLGRATDAKPDTY